MVDLTATDELRKMLDELGVEWYAPTSFDGTSRYDTTAGDYWFHEFNGKITIHGLTPEQAIAVTLYSGEYECKMDALLCRLTNGKFSKTRTYDLDFMESVVREEFETMMCEL